MSVENYSNRYVSNTKRKNNQKNSVENMENKLEKKRDTANVSEYLQILQKKNPTLNLISGIHNTSKRFSNSSINVDVIIAPNILEQMASDSNEEQKYSKMLSEIPRCIKWANSIIQTMTSNQIQYRQIWIDENGNIGSFSISGSCKEQNRHINYI